MSTYNRDKEIRERLNRFLIEVIKLPPNDYAKKMDLVALLALKSIFSDINNYITLKLALGLGEWVADSYKLDETARETISRIILETKPNSNGHDLWLGYPMCFMAEVKCNIPINGGDKYGAQQKRGIIEDINSLITGKRKSPMISEGVLKFMGFLDTPMIRAANAHLLKTTPAIAEKITFSTKDTPPSDTTIVHGIYIKF